MNCPTESELIDYLFSGDRASRAALEAHFSACAGCRLKIEALGQLKTAAASVPPSPVSADFTARLMRNLKDQEPATEASDMGLPLKRLFRPAWGFSLAAFAGALILGTVYFSGRRVLPENSQKTLYFSDGPATVNKHFSVTEKVPARGDVSGQPRTRYVYTDNCETANCGIL